MKYIPLFLITFCVSERLDFELDGLKSVGLVIAFFDLKKALKDLKTNATKDKGHSRQCKGGYQREENGPE